MQRRMPALGRAAANSPRWSAGRRVSVVLSTTAALTMVGLLASGPASAAGSVVVSKTDDLDPAGEAITVAGSGFREDQGIYVSVCVDNGPGVLPTPCLGGVDTAGESESSAWVSSNPPSYAEGLTTPYGPGGTFEVTIFAVGSDPKTGIDCAAVTCSVVTRSDHTATDDRSQDTRTPLTFRAPGSPTATPTTTAPTQTAETDDSAAATTVVATPPPASGASDGSAAPVAPEPDSGGSVPAPVWVGGGVLAAVAASALVLRSRRTEKGISQ